MTHSPEPSRFQTREGTNLFYQTLGTGRQTLLLHGLLASGNSNWIAPGIADRLAAAGRQVVMPDFRGHGRSDAPREASAYPVDVLATDQIELLSHLAWDDFDLVGYSLGARIAVRMLVRQVKPGRAVLGGMGGMGITNVDPGRDQFMDLVVNGPRATRSDAGSRVWGMMEAAGIKREAVIHVLNQQVSTTPAELAAIDCPVQVLCGDRDFDNGDPTELAGLIPGSSLCLTAGSHMSAIAKPDFVAAMIAFLQTS